VIQAWDTLPDTVRARILGMVEGATAMISAGPCSQLHHRRQRPEAR
jgi:hypothetical protein